jgi:hypothetical protein
MSRGFVPLIISQYQVSAVMLAQLLDGAWVNRHLTLLQLEAGSSDNMGFRCVFASASQRISSQL